MPFHQPISRFCSNSNAYARKGIGVESKGGNEPAVVPAAPLDIHKKLFIVKSVRSSKTTMGLALPETPHLICLATTDTNNEVHHIPTKKLASKILIPQFVDIDSYDWDSARTFAQTNSYA